MRRDSRLLTNIYSMEYTDSLTIIIINSDSREEVLYCSIRLCGSSGYPSPSLNNVPKPGDKVTR